MTFRLTAPCHFGLEKTLSFEVRRIGGEDIAVSDGRVTFTGDERVLIRANMCLSTAERVGILLSEFKARTFEELFQGVKAIPIEKYVGKFDRFPIKGFSLNSKLTSVPACQKIIKKAMVERMKSVYKIGYFQETEALFQFRFSIMKDNVTMTLDTSGEGLHKRGYRVKNVEAPIKETLAAAMVQLSFWKPERLLLDPFCGSGTIAIEAAMYMRNIAPGLGREFASQKWDCIPQEIWKEEKKSAYEAIDYDKDIRIEASDVSKKAVAAARENAEEAGVDDCISFSVRPFERVEPAEKYSVIICNPPYGERIGKKDAMKASYAHLKELLEKDSTLSAYVITADKQIEAALMPRKPDRRRKLYNGRIETCYYQYYGQKPKKEIE